MGLQFRCENEKRSQAVREHATLNGIDYLEVLDVQAPPGSPRQRTLLVHCFRSLPSSFSRKNVMIKGGVRITPIEIAWAHPAATIPSSLTTAGEKMFFASLSHSDRVLVVRTESFGDFSTYTLRLVQSLADASPPANFDPLLSEIRFSFKVECPSEFDCEPTPCPPESLTEPEIDYLAKDYASFRRLMLDRMSIIMPDWKERNPADLGIAVVELLAYAGDQLSYYQDAIATEAYLDTARSRVSVRRHARLLDYPMHDGSNARAWVTLKVGAAADGYVLKGPSESQNLPGAQLLTQIDNSGGGLNLDESDVLEAVSKGAVVFETMHDVTLRMGYDEIHFYTWGDERCCLPKGATEATLKNDGDKYANLAVGDVLIFEEVRGPRSGKKEDADLSHRHAVWLTKVSFEEDPLFKEVGDPLQNQQVINIAWDFEDALPFPLCLWEVEDESKSQQPVSVARGNVALVDHGRTISGEQLDAVPSAGEYRPRLQFGPLTQQGRVRGEKGEPMLFDPNAAASAAMQWKLQDARPAIRLVQDSDVNKMWLPQRDLLNSDRFSSEFVIETEDDQRTYLRFGDGVLGKSPPSGAQFAATYRVGNGPTGNVGAEAIAHVVTTQDGILSVRNPMPAGGGVEAESTKQVKLYAGQAFRVQERAVTEQDYATVAQRHPEVQNAMGTRRWTGSWHTMFVTVDRIGGRPVDAKFKGQLQGFLERFRLAGYDLEIDEPHFIPLDIGLKICAKPGYAPDDVKQGLLNTFSMLGLASGQRGFFHPDNFTFGQPVYLSQVLAAAMDVPGVDWVAPVRFQRWGRAAGDELKEGKITMGRLEIARLDNDANAPENGKLEFEIEGGI